MKRTTVFRLPTVPAAAPVTSSSKGVSPLRALAGLFVWVLLSALGSLAPMPSYAATTCGGDGERACCLGERSFGACTSGLIEASGCTGDCTCGGVNPLGIRSSGHCVPRTSCGSAGQRACCIAERIPPCNQGLTEIVGCTGNCTCGGVNPGGLLNSRDRCSSLPCGGAGQRACCATERSSSCNPGLIEVAGCTTVNCTCGGVNPGGDTFNRHCATPPTITRCGGAGQRACCATERISPCDQGFIAVLGCNGNCLCGGGPPATYSSRRCEPNPACPNARNNLAAMQARKIPIETELARANAELAALNSSIAAADQAVQQQCRKVRNFEGDCLAARNNLASLSGQKKQRETALAGLNADLYTANSAILAAGIVVAQQCGPSSGNMPIGSGVPGGVPALLDKATQPVDPAHRRPVTR